MAFKVIKFLSTAALAVMAAGLLAPAANAHQVYRIVGPDGKVSFSDPPPPATSNAKATTSAGNPGASSGASGSALPYELRQIANKYPVTLYTGENCGPCASARSLLTGRGIPFTEKIIVSPEAWSGLLHNQQDSIDSVTLKARLSVYSNYFLSITTTQRSTKMPETSVKGCGGSSTSDWTASIS